MKSLWFLKLIAQPWGHTLTHLTIIMQDNDSDNIKVNIWQIWSSARVFMPHTKWKVWTEKVVKMHYVLG